MNPNAATQFWAVWSCWVWYRMDSAALRNWSRLPDSYKQRFQATDLAALVYFGIRK